MAHVSVGANGKRIITLTSQGSGRESSLRVGVSGQLGSHASEASFGHGKESWRANASFVSCSETSRGRAQLEAKEARESNHADEYVSEMLRPPWVVAGAEPWLSIIFWPDHLQHMRFARVCNRLHMRLE